MLALLETALGMGWPVLVVLVGVLLYCQVRITDPAVRRRATFKTLIGMLAVTLLLIAVANYRLNFFGDTRLLPLSLGLITTAAFVTALYFARVSAMFKIGGFMFLVAAALSGFGNWLPQVEGGFPPPTGGEGKDYSIMSTQQLADEGEKILFGGIGLSRVQGSIGKGQCPLCHGFYEGSLSERAPNLLGIPERAQKRLADPRYHKGSAGERDTVQKESFPGAGTAETAEEYIAESHVCPSCYVVQGFGVKGTNDSASSMPMIHKPPISLTLGEMAAVDTWLFVREGKEPPSYEEIVKAHEKFTPKSELVVDGNQEPPDVPSGSIVSGKEPLEQVFAKAKCVLCHTIPGIAGAVGTVGPKLVEKTNAPIRLKDPAYRGNAKTVRDYIAESIIAPGTYVAKPFPDNVMPRDFGDKLSAGALTKIVDYLSQLEEGKAPPKL